MLENVKILSNTNIFREKSLDKCWLRNKFDNEKNNNKIKQTNYLFESCSNCAN